MNPLLLVTYTCITHFLSVLTFSLLLYLVIFCYVLLHFCYAYTLFFSFVLPSKIPSKIPPSPCPLPTIYFKPMPSPSHFLHCAKKPKVTRHFDYCPSGSEGDNQSVGSSAPVVSRCFPGGYNVKLYISRGRLAWWLLVFLCCAPPNPIYKS